MSFEQGEVNFDVASFAAGFLDSPEEDTLPAGGTRDAKNCLLINISTQDGERAVLRKRNGSLLLNPTAIASGKAIDGAFSFSRETGDDELIVVCNGAAYKWDGASTFSALTGGTGFTVGNKVTFLAFKNNLFIMDGVQQLRYNGTACFPVGATAPANAIVLTVGAATGPTGTYEGYWVGYDPAIDHETSPSPFSAQVAFVNQKRVWTLPAHTLPANYTFWRVYCRRVDTNEANYFRVGTVAIGTGSLTETISDASRRDPGPAVNSNDPPPVFALAEEFKGYRFGVPANSSNLYVSKIGDPESQNAKDVFPIGGKGDTKPVRSVRKYATDCIARKPTRSYRIVGDRLPFTIEPIDSSMGGVSQKSGIEVDSWWYDWDLDRGPYRTNLAQFESIGDTRINRLLATVNKQAAHLIECEHFKTLNLVVWSIPTGSTSRKRTLLPFNYRLGRWLPPTTGMEYSSLAAHTTTAGDYGVYFGDEWGRVYKLWSGEIDGVPSGDTRGIILGATSSTITCPAAAFYTTGSGLAGMTAMVVHFSGTIQWVRIASNTGTALTLDVVNGPALSPLPSLGNSYVYIGAIEWYWWTPRFTGGDPFTKKNAGWIYMQGSTTSLNTALSVDVRFDRGNGIAYTYTFRFEPTGLVWGSGLWGEPWGEGGARKMVKRRLPRAFYDISFRFSNFFPNQPVEITAVRATADWLRRRRPGG